jgi:hypothetical protein
MSDSSRQRKRAALALSAVILAALVAVVAPSRAAIQQRSVSSRAAFKATLTAPTHHAKAGTKWFYTVRVTDLTGKPIRARISVQIVDPLGSVHPVQYANTKKNLTNWPINGHFRDYIIWPRSSAIGISLTLRVIVRTAKGKLSLAYSVSPRA